LIPFSPFKYDKDFATLSIVLSAAAFALPAVFLKLRLPRMPALSDRAMGRLLIGVMLTSGVILAVSSIYHFRVVGLTEIYDYRGQVEMPKILRYGDGITVGALLPYAFAMFAARGRWAFAALAAAMLAAFYPVNLMKLALFAPFWLVFLLLLFRFAEERVATVLSLLLPLVAGLATMIPRGLGLLSDGPHVNAVFGLINFRMFAVPAISLDLYSDFFAKNPLTGFCQISWIKPFVSCAYPASLAETLAETYRFGTLNASLLATEGIASVGQVYAPIAAFACGLVVAVANGMSRHWPQRFVILSAGVVLQSFLSVPFTTILLTNGAGVLFVLWYLTPASYFVADER
jgi:hypothetical protein